MTPSLTNGVTTATTAGPKFRLLSLVMMIDDRQPYNEVAPIAARLAIRSYAGSGQLNTVVSTSGARGEAGVAYVALPGSSGMSAGTWSTAVIPGAWAVEEYCRDHAGT